jgi:DNA polymerase elongation subunit (family B)
VICTQPTEAVNNTVVIQVTSEAQLLSRARAVIRQYDPDILTGYNLTFDNNFLKERATGCGGKVYDEFCDVSRVIGVNAAFKVQKLTNAAMGTNERVLWDIPGRIVLDLFMYCKTNFSYLPSFKLDYVGHHFIKAGKVDMPWGRIIQSFSDSGTAAERGEVAHNWYEHIISYMHHVPCLHYVILHLAIIHGIHSEIDGLLCLQLLAHWSSHTAILEESAVSAVNASTIVDSGRQVKVISLLLSETYGRYVYNPPIQANDTDTDNTEAVGYQGATVIDTCRGFYGGPNDQVCLLDFARYVYPHTVTLHSHCTH